MSKQTRRSKLKPRREYDERLMATNADVQAQLILLFGENAPRCPACKSTNAKSAGNRKGVVIGSKPTYKCKDCGISYSEDDSRYRNVFLEKRALEMVQIGGREQVQAAIELLQSYGVNTENMTTMRVLRNLLKR